ncbi:MAG: prepilin peptidase [Candidatus Omnitrophica bacterium]|nr:prepilin peptidase [Candidatus Omnitrophota bacterium]
MKQWVYLAFDTKVLYNNTMIGIFIFILGLAFGSFANVVIYRLPKGKSIVRPGSQCPSCGKNIPWYDNIPILSFLLLKGRCRFCKVKISSRYFVVELITGLLFLGLYLKFGLTVQLLIYIFFTLCLLIMGFIDIDTYLISDVIVLPGIAIGFLCSIFFPQMHYDMTRSGSIWYSFIGILVGSGILIFLAMIGRLLFKKEAMGGGDIKLLSMIGAFSGWKSVFITIFFASLLGTLISLTLIGLKKKKIDDYVPFGPYLGLGAIIAIFYKGLLFLGFFIN